MSKVVSMFQMFYNAISFDQSLGAWNVSSVGGMGEMLSFSGLSTANYDATLQGWAVQSGLQNGVPLDATGLSYCMGESARQTLITTYGWTIDDAGKACP